ncbi:hypothetical protein PHLCEN_2v13184 [Hermanssonia centrifuga]|uniref:Uncharacterized protein n=1 Tax=Hermanssonia centrifuga TaxID=98765 RepID=A0A2R6NEX8_9APHY|nr:hypothetical protein PHLCEN_2v13184 [Hermanssonia centrifuga]
MLCRYSLNPGLQDSEAKRRAYKNANMVSVSNNNYPQLTNNLADISSVKVLASIETTIIPTLNIQTSSRTEPTTMLSTSSHGSTSTLTSTVTYKSTSALQQKSEKDYLTVYGTLQNTYGGFAGTGGFAPTPTIPRSTKRKQKPSVSVTLPSATSSRSSNPSPTKDYETTFGVLASKYGFGAPVQPPSMCSEPKQFSKLKFWRR